METELKVGLHEGLTFEEYASLPAVNNGAIGWGMKSMKHMRAYLNGEMYDKDSAAKKFGRAVHARVFEPSTYRERFAIAEMCESCYGSGIKKGMRCGRAGKFLNAGHWYCGQHKPSDGRSTEPSDYINFDETARIERIAESLQGHGIGAVLDLPGSSEVSVVWQYSDLWLKGRIDRLIPGRVLDLKKCQVGAANHNDCQKAVYNYNMHRQAAMYVWGVEATGGLRSEFWWIFIEDGPPYDIYPMQADFESLSIGLSEVKHILDLWQKAVESGNYPGCSGAVKKGGLPEYARPRSMEHLERE